MLMKTRSNLQSKPRMMLGMNIQILDGKILHGDISYIGELGKSQPPSEIQDTNDKTSDDEKEANGGKSHA
jgi:hypothetical protein